MGLRTLRARGSCCHAQQRPKHFPIHQQEPKKERVCCVPMAIQPQEWAWLLEGLVILVDKVVQLALQRVPLLVQHWRKDWKVCGDRWKPWRHKVHRCIRLPWL